ncbi:hypothetical protein BH23ACT5_BH23ACT5_04250 [soil metagenome]
MQFEITFDYLCPFARNAHEAVLDGLGGGFEWKVTFRPFSLSQAHVEEGQPEVFGDLTAPGIRALHWSLAVRDAQPERFGEAHVALFAARHDHGLDISDETVLASALEDAGVDVYAAAALESSGGPARTLAAEHAEGVEMWGVFGVPTFVKDDVATFVRFMERGNVDHLVQVLDLLGWHGLNEFKRTRVPR